MIEEIPLTLDVLLNPREGDQVTQSNEHERHLGTLIDRLRRFLEPRGWGVFSDVMIHWRRGRKKTSPDVAAVEGVVNPKAGRGSLDLKKERGQVRAVFELVSTSTKDQRAKDEKHGPGRYARRGVEDFVLFYPPERRDSEDPAVRVYSLAGKIYKEQTADAKGRFLLGSLGLWLSVGEHGDLILEVVATGERLLTSEEEEAGRREAQRQADEATQALARTLLNLLENRQLPFSADARRRILDCRDLSRLELWIAHAFTVASVDDLWDL